jgi:hypothetical protein
MDIIKILSEELKLTEDQVTKTVALMDEGNTIPFIARYRKEVTGSLDDVTLRALEDRLNYLRKLEERKAVKGICGSFVAWWFPGFFSMTRYALGRLQFEIVKFERNYDKNGVKLTPDSRVINVHIPRTGTPMDKESCDKAYAQAREFFKDEVGENCPFICYSWLLYPENKNILSPKSNTYRFMSEYDVIESVNNNGDDLWRLFDTDEKDPNKLPTDSSFRRAYVEHLKNGGKVGEGLGVKI